MPETLETSHPQAKNVGPPRVDQTTSFYLTLSSVLMTAIAVLFLLGLCTVQLVVVPRYIVIFQDFDMQLPWLTIRLITIPTFVYLAACALGVIVLIVKEAIPQPHFGFKLVINLLAILLCLIMYFVYAIGLWLPMNQMMESLM